MHVVQPAGNKALTHSHDSRVTASLARVYVRQVAPSLKQEVVELLDVLLDLHQAFLPEGDAQHTVNIAQLSGTLIHLSRRRPVQQMAALLTTLLRSYGATLSSTDRALGRLLRNVNSLLVQAQPEWAAQLEQVRQQALERQQQVGLVNLAGWRAREQSAAVGGWAASVQQRALAMQHKVGFSS